MDGFSNNANSDIRWATARKGQWTIFTDKPEPGTVEIQLQDEESTKLNAWLFDHFTGFLIGITILEADAEKAYSKPFWCFKMFAKKTGKQVNLKIPYDSGYFHSFVKRIFNIDTLKEFSFFLQYEEKDGKKMSSCFVRQDGELVKPAITAEDPKDVPRWEEKIEIENRVEVKKWSKTKYFEYWEKKLIEDLPRSGKLNTIEDLKKIYGTSTDDSKEWSEALKEEESNTFIEDDPAGDLPF